MIPFVQCSDKIDNDLEQKTQKKFARDGTMCKDKWNSLNSNNKKLIDYHKGIEIILTFGIYPLIYIYVPFQFNKKFYELIEAF